MSHLPILFSSRSQAVSWILRALATRAVFALSAAGGNGGGGGGDGGGAVGPGVGPGGTAGQPVHLEFFQASLHAIDPADPTTVLTIDADAAEIIDSE